MNDDDYNDNLNEDQSAYYNSNNESDQYSSAFDDMYNTPTQYTHNALTPPEEPSLLLQGTIGAILGSLVGVAFIAFMSQSDSTVYRYGTEFNLHLMYSFPLGSCTCLGYKWLGKSIDKKGGVICIIIIIVMVFFGFVLSLAIFNTQLGFGSVTKCFSLIVERIVTGELALNDYIVSLGMFYSVTALGCYTTIKDALKK